MKNRFAEFYELSDIQIKDIWKNSLIVFDTNVLLNLYRYNDSTRDEFFKVIRFYKNRLWIPYQVGLEFHKRREEIIRKNASAYELLGDKLTEQLLKSVDALSSERDFARHPYIDMGHIKSKIKRCSESIAKSLKQQGKEHPDYSKKDNILSTITELFAGKVGEDFVENDLENLYKEGEKRYSNEVPPGYCDEKNKKEKSKRSLYGDLIVWKQTIRYSSEQKRNVIFVTDDHKKDWWDKIDGKHSPRKELIKEFKDSTGQDVLIYDSSRFLEYAKRNKVLAISQKMINEVEKIQIADITRQMDEMNRSILGIPNLYGLGDTINSINKLYHPLSSYGLLSNTSYLDDWRETVLRVDGLAKIDEFIERLQRFKDMGVSLNKQLTTNKEKDGTIEDKITSE